MSLSYTCSHLMKQNCIDYQHLSFHNHGEGIDIAVPNLTPEQLTATIKTVKTKRYQTLRQMKTNDIIEVLDEAVHLWLNPKYELRQFAETALPIITGYDHEMIRLFIPRYFRNFRKQKLQRIVEEDFPNPLVLDEFRPRISGGLRKAYGPECTTHIFSGNVPGLPLWSLISGLLVKSATIGKVSSSEPLFPFLFTQTLEQISPSVAQSIGMFWWKGGQEELEKIAFSHSEAVISYGNQRTIQRISKKIPSTVRHIAHGHKVSFSVITSECLDPSLIWDTVNRAARDVTSFDQQGCLSPHVIYVEEAGKNTPRDFARMLGQELDNLATKYPRGSVTDEETNAILKFRLNAEFQAMASENVELHTSEKGTSWTVVYREDPSKFSFSPLNRVITVVPIANIEVIRENTNDIREFVQTVGIGCPPQKLERLVNLLGECHVNRVCAIGEMPQPEPGWHHDGRFNLGELVYWTDIESSVEEQMDLVDPLRD